MLNVVKCQSTSRTGETKREENTHALSSLFLFFLPLLFLSHFLFFFHLPAFLSFLSLAFFPFSPSFFVLSLFLRFFLPFSFISLFLPSLSLSSCLFLFFLSSQTNVSVFPLKDKQKSRECLSSLLPLAGNVTTRSGRACAPCLFWNSF